LTGGVIGQPLVMEGVFSFFLESAFLGLFLYGEKRLGPRGHWWSAVLVFLGSWLSGYFIVATDAWMQHPVAYQRAADGSFQVTIEVVSAGVSGAAAAAVGGPAESRIVGITSALLDEIPRRVSDQQRNPGDMVNILILGTEDQVVKAFTTAGWVHVDSSVQETVLSGLVESLEKKDYLTMPMSTLYLFNRAQDYGFAHAEPVRVAMSRNHLRVWKSPYTAEGKQVWCVAATHDIGFERDQRNNGLTHKIDPAIDGEREYVNGTLAATGLVAARDHVTPSNPLTEAKTATGGSFHSDGRILVLVLRSSPDAAN